MVVRGIFCGRQNGENNEIVARNYIRKPNQKTYPHCARALDFLPSQAQEIEGVFFPPFAFLLVLIIEYEWVKRCFDKYFTLGR